MLYEVSVYTSQEMADYISRMVSAGVDAVAKNSKTFLFFEERSEESAKDIAA